MARIEDLSRLITKELDNYSIRLDKGLRDVEKKVTNEAVKAIKSKSPKDTGGYAAGWTTKRDGNKIVIYNRTRYQLTHLLEKGHAKVNGGRVAPRVHIRPAEEKANKDFMDAVERLARG